MWPLSNFGSAIDIVAPAVSIPAPAGAGYVCDSGTSFAAPFVTGAIATYLGEHPAASPADVRTWLLGQADNVSGVPYPVLSIGNYLRINVSGDGQAVSAGNEILCGRGEERCAWSFPKQTHIALSAIAAPGSVFAGWSGGLYGCNDNYRGRHGCSQELHRRFSLELRDWN